MGFKNPPAISASGHIIH